MFGRYYFLPGLTDRPKLNFILKTVNLRSASDEISFQIKFALDDEIHQSPCQFFQKLLPVLDGGVQREEEGGERQERPAVRGDDVRGDPQPRVPRHCLLRRAGRRLRPLFRRRDQSPRP